MSVENTSDSGMEAVEQPAASEPDHNAPPDFPIRTTVARHYYWKQVITIVVCVAFTVWGAWDYWITLPAQREHHAKWDRFEELRDKRDGVGALTTAEAAEFQGLDAYTDEKERGAMKEPAGYDPLVCWLFMSCILVVPWSAWRIHALSRNKYVLEESGDLTLADGTTWGREEIAGIDMSRWMEKSVAWVQHTDGRREKLDAYFRARLELIIGEIAHRFDPDAWYRNGKPAVMPEEPQPEPAVADAYEPSPEREDQPVV